MRSSAGQGLRRPFAAAGLLVLGGCLGDTAPAVETTTEPLTQCPRAAVLQGVDVSEYQRAIDWGAVSRSGRTFAVARVSDGYYLDHYFPQNWEGIRAAGLVRGVYQFFRPRLDPVAQANLLLARIGALAPGDLAPMLDVEVTDGASPGEMNAAIHAWVSRIQSATGRVPIIYAGSYFWDGNVGTGDFSGNPLWLPAYGPLCPRLPNAWSHWTFHQYASTGVVPGIAGNVDVDKFNGTLDQLHAFGGGAACAAHCEGSTVVGSDCTRGDCGVFGSACVSDALGARCVFAFCPATGERDVCWSGTHLGHCLNGSLTSQGDCGVYGARCVADDLGARCVFALCPATGDTDICVTDTRIAHCHNGAVPSQGDCGVFGAHCVHDALGARCVFAYCPAMGEADVCWSGSHVGHCHNGALASQGDCAAFAGICSSAGAPGGRCVSVFCVPSADVAPVAHDGCWIQPGQVAHCDGNGAIHLEDCTAGQQCSNVGGARCVPAVCPPAGRTEVCLDGHLLGHCIGGTVADAVDCSRVAAYCTTAAAGAGTGGTARCVSSYCVAGPTEVPVAHDVCLPDGQRAHCSAVGDLETPGGCPAGTHCGVDETGVQCLPGPVPDAGTMDASAEASDAVSSDAGPDDGGMRAPSDVRGAWLDGGPFAPAVVEGGCGCRIGTPRYGGARIPAALLLAGLFIRRRRRDLGATSVRPRCDLGVQEVMADRTCGRGERAPG